MIPRTPHVVFLKRLIDILKLDEFEDCSIYALQFFGKVQST